MAAMRQPSIKTGSARVVRLSRRYVDIILDTGEVLRATSETQAREVTVGDLIRYEDKQGGLVIQEIMPRRNCLERSYQNSTKKLAANVDLVLIISAITPLFNTAFIDRILVEARSQGIECLFVINKAIYMVDQCLPALDLEDHVND